MAKPIPPLRGILETVIYCSPAERERVEAFYSGVLGLAEVSHWEDGTSFRVGAGVLLLFDLDKLGARETAMSDHGATGPGHVCFVVDRDDYGSWAERLRAEDVDIVQEQEWRDGLRSFYFRDPAGNLLEIADGDIWPGTDG